MLYLLAFTALYSPLLLGSVGLFITGDIFLHYTGVQLSFAQQVVLYSLLSTFPLAGFIAGSLLDYFCLTSSRLSTFRLLSAVLAFSLVLEAPSLVEFMQSAISVVTTNQIEYAQVFKLLAVVVSSICFCSFAVAFILITLNLLAELPARWIAENSAVTLSLPWEGLRPLVISALLLLSLNHIIGLFSAELWPLTILGQFTSSTP